jgi:hypothetical protein
MYCIKFINNVVDKAGFGTLQNFSILIIGLIIREIYKIKNVVIVNLPMSEKIFSPQSCC